MPLQMRSLHVGQSQKCLMLKVNYVYTKIILNNNFIENFREKKEHMSLKDYIYDLGIERDIGSLLRSQQKDLFFLLNGKESNQVLYEKMKTVRKHTPSESTTQYLFFNLQGKEGFFRHNLLGKRLNYSARSVIVSGPHLPFGSCGVPEFIALELFQNYIKQYLLTKELFQFNNISKKVNKDLISLFFGRKTKLLSLSIYYVVPLYSVILNRAPTLHRVSVQSYKPYIVDGMAIHFHPLSCAPFNADFDGDQIGLYLPLSENSKKESKDFLASGNNLLSVSDGSVLFSPSQDSLLGLAENSSPELLSRNFYFVGDPYELKSL
eukprot:GHVL01014005.1.p1 GENE.GHVL01014005.1~~GHVL01014005.1.p1  ORF type:complete len:321 (-),score=23.78 GHVL01014005.1:366-1328(-)